ncbi:hypothetical protein ERJ75_000697500 [Trypanosoma vivax]|nr:hypothetical protein ERJ75_000697500 [Trypanosoma vivax]
MAAHEAEAWRVQRAALVRQGRHGRRRGGDAEQPARATKWRTREGKAGGERAASPRRFGTPPKTTPAAGRRRHMRHQRTRYAEESARGATEVTRAGAEEERQHEQHRHAGDASCGGPWNGTCGRGPDREGEDGREELLRGFRKYAWREKAP